MEHEGIGDEQAVRVVVADSSQIHTQLLVDALGRDRCLEVFASDSESLVATAVAPRVDVLVISSNLDGQANRGFELLRELRAAIPELRSVVLLDSSKSELIVEAFRAGAR